MVWMDKNSGNVDASASPMLKGGGILWSEELKGILTDSNNIFSWHESEEIKKAYFQNLSWFQVYIYKLCMITCVGIAP